MKTKTTLRAFILAFFFVAGLVMPPIPVNATLLIMPIHLILTDRDRTGNITLFNTSGEAATFKIGWRYQKQLETGAYEVSDTPFDPEHDLSKFAIFSPRQVTLQAAEKQRIRISIRRPPDLPGGEYRAHLALMRINPNAPGQQPGTGDQADDATPETDAAAAPTPPPGAPKTEAKMDVSLKMNVSYSLPVVVRQGSYDSTASIVEAKLVPADPANPRPDPNGKVGNPQLHVVLSRTGNFSVFGKVLVYATSAGQPEKQIGVTNNVNILPEITRRELNVYLTESPAPGTSLRVVYQGEVKEKGVTLDQKTFPVGG